MKNSECFIRFPILSRITQTLLTIAFSTAEIERLFSSLKLTKTPLRNRLNDETLNNILTTKQNLKRGTMNFDEYPKEDLKKLKTLIIQKNGKGNNVDNQAIQVNLRPNVSLL